MILKRVRIILPFKFYNLHLGSPADDLPEKVASLIKKFPVSGEVNKLVLGWA
jgi:hypothetical protein